MLKMPLSLVGVGLMLACSPKTPQATGLEYPSSPQGDVVDIYHGTSVPDPYRWLEDPNSEESRVWIEAQNALTYAWLEEIPQRPVIRDRVEALWNYERYSSPTLLAGKYYYFRNDGLQNQSVLYVSETLEAEGEVVLDPNAFSETARCLWRAGIPRKRASTWPTPRTGFRLAPNACHGFGDRRDLEDKLDWVKFSRASWNADETGFFTADTPNQIRHFKKPTPCTGCIFTALERLSRKMCWCMRTRNRRVSLVWETRTTPCTSWRTRTARTIKSNLVQDVDATEWIQF